MSRKKFPPRPDAEKIFVSRSSPLPVSVPLDSLERGSLWLVCHIRGFHLPVVTTPIESQNLASGPGIWVSTMVLLEARGLSLFLVIRGGIACISDSVPKHTGPNSLTDTHLEPSVSRTRPTTTRENRRRWKGLFITDAQASCRCNCVASKSTPFFQIVRVMLAIFRARVRRAIVGRIPFSRRAT
jgi:hypothetical protein